MTETKIAKDSQFDPATKLDPVVRWGLATVSAGAAFLHFAAVGDHFSLSAAHGIFFAAAAWLQLAFAVAVILRPNRWWMWFGVVLNLFIATTWVISRVWGLPVGPSSWTPEPAAFPDVLATIFEVVLIVGCLAVVTGFVARHRINSAVALPVVGAIGASVILLSTIAFVPAVAGAENSHTTMSAAGTTGVSADGHHGATTAAGTTKAGTTTADTTTGGIEAANGDSPCEKTGPPSSPGQAAGGHGKRGPSITYPITDAATRVTLGTQLVQARQAAESLPTAADAVAAGYRKVTTYLPCIGAHYMKFSIVDGNFDPTAVEMMLYSGDGPDAKVVGLSYYMMSGAAPPEGFAGPNDTWHQHIGLCVKSGIVIGPEKWTAEECAAKGGEKGGGENAWMMHAWVVPGWESSWGIFSGEHPELGKTAAA